jgi:hypothetical protein
MAAGKAARDEVDALYGLPLEDFTAARNALARSLRERGDRTSAQDVGKLPKPTRVAWMVNQLARARPRELAAYLKAGDKLAKLHGRPLNQRGAATELRKAAEAERVAIAPLLEAARGFATKQGRFPSEGAVEGVRETLQGALVDESARPLLEQGRLTVEIPPPGLGFGAPMPSAPPASRRAPSRAATRAQDARREKELREAQRAEKQARDALEEAKRNVTTRARERDRAVRAVSEAERALERRERELIRAKGRLEDARGVRSR